MAAEHATPDVVVIGGGLAGISAAIELTGAGAAVTLLEARPWLGGATFSFARRGLTIDNGQHLFLGCCHAYRELLARLGVSSSCAVQDALDCTVLGAGAQARLRGSWLPAPLHLVVALAGYQLLRPSDRVKAAAAAMALRFAEFGSQAEESFSEWLARHGQGEQPRQMFWDLLAGSSLGVPASQASLGQAAAAVKIALGGRDRAGIGVARVPLGQLHGVAAAELLDRLGAEVALSAKVTGIAACGPAGYRVQFYNGGTHCIGAAAVVLAVPAWDAAALAPAALSASAANWAALTPSPVLSVHVMYNAKITSIPLAAVVGARPMWIVDKTNAAGMRAGQYLAVAVPAADGYLDWPASQLRAEFEPLLARLFPAAGDASIEDFFVTKERRARIGLGPGAQRLRPAQATGLPGFALAGAWTDTGWPDSMEGAVRSGRRAAELVIADLAGADRRAYC